MLRFCFLIFCPAIQILKDLYFQKLTLRSISKIRKKGYFKNKKCHCWQKRTKSIGPLPVVVKEGLINPALSVLSSDLVSEEIYKKSRSSGGQFARAYGLAKVHKNNTPLKPILCMPCSCYQNYSLTLAKILAKVPKFNIQTRSGPFCKRLISYLFGCRSATGVV